MGNLTGANTCHRYGIEVEVGNYTAYSFAVSQLDVCLKAQVRRTNADMAQTVSERSVQNPSWRIDE
jgi:hypothetical protein